MDNGETRRRIRSFGLCADARTTNLPMVGREDIRDWIEDSGYLDERFRNYIRPIIVHPTSAKYSGNTRVIAHLIAKVIALHAGLSHVKVLSLLDILDIMDQNTDYTDLTAFELLVLDDFVETMPNPLPPREQLAVRTFVRRVMRLEIGIVVHSHAPISVIKEWWGDELYNEIAITGKIIAVSECQTD